jgi:hypothetical protein
MRCWGEPQVHADDDGCDDDVFNGPGSCEADLKSLSGIQLLPNLEQEEAPISGLVAVFVDCLVRASLNAQENASLTPQLELYGHSVQNTL